MSNLNQLIESWREKSKGKEDKTRWDFFFKFFNQLQLELPNFDSELGKVRQELREVKHELGNKESELGKVSQELNEVKQELVNKESELGKVSQELNEVKQELGNKESELGKVRQDSVNKQSESVKNIPNDIPNHFEGWTVSFKKKYYELNKRINGKLRWIYIGKTWDTEKASLKIKEFYADIN